MEEAEKRRRTVVVLFAVAILAAAAVTLIGALLFGLDCEDGDGGVPFVARDSPQAGVCASTASGLGALAICALTAAAMALLAVKVGRRYTAERSGLLLLLASALAVPLAPLVALALLNAPSNECSGEKLDAYEAWVQGGGGPEAAPYECASY